MFVCAAGCWFQLPQPLPGWILLARSGIRGCANSKHRTFASSLEVFSNHLTCRHELVDNHIPYLSKFLIAGAFSCAVYSNLLKRHLMQTKQSLPFSCPLPPFPSSLLLSSTTISSVRQPISASLILAPSTMDARIIEGWLHDAYGEHPPPVSRMTPAVPAASASVTIDLPTSQRPSSEHGRCDENSPNPSIPLYRDTCASLKRKRAQMEERGVGESNRGARSASPRKIRRSSHTSVDDTGSRRGTRPAGSSYAASIQKSSSIVSGDLNLTSATTLPSVSDKASSARGSGRNRSRSPAKTVRDLDVACPPTLFRQFHPGTDDVPTVVLDLHRSIRVAGKREYLPASIRVSFPLDVDIRC